MSQPWADNEDADLLKFRRSGKTFQEIGSKLGRSDDSVRKRYARLTSAKPDAEIETVRMENAALRARLAAKPEITSEADSMPEPSVSELWQEAEEAAIKRVARESKRANFSANMGDKAIAVAFIADQHIAPGTIVDFKRMREDAELIGQTDGMYAVLAGDLVDNHIRIVQAMLAARSQPEDQWKLLGYYLEIFADKILAMTAGNHDLWTNAIAGVDVLRRIADQQKIRYSQDQFFLTVTVGGVPYKIGVRHQFRMNSSFNQTHANKQWLRLMDADGVDVTAIGHHHEAALESHIYRGKHCISIRPGSYQISTSYSAYHGWNASIPTCPTVIFFPRERKLTGFFDLRLAAQALPAFRDAR